MGLITTKLPPGRLHISGVFPEAPNPTQDPTVDDSCCGAASCLRTPHPLQCPHCPLPSLLGPAVMATSLLSAAGSALHRGPTPSPVYLRDSPMSLSFCPPVAISGCCLPEMVAPVGELQPEGHQSLWDIPIIPKKPEIHIIMKNPAVLNTGKQFNIFKIQRCKWNRLWVRWLLLVCHCLPWSVLPSFLSVIMTNTRILTVSPAVLQVSHT